ncbi:MAG TPA: trigger factor [Humisphaera sp.]|nr:trigger factor [Humisphaera sp.]
MAENEAGVVDQGQAVEQEEGFLYPITVEDIGPAEKKIRVEIPRERITEALDEQYKELRQKAQIPGFRVGHVPRKLLEKKFSQDVKEQVASTLVRESYEQALSKNKLSVIGDPEFEDKEAVKLPEEGSLTYAFQVEVQPDITLPDFANLKVKKPKITISEANIDQAMQNLREQQGALLPVENRGVQAGDYLLADVLVKLDGNVVGQQPNANLVVRAGRIGGIQVEDLDVKLADLMPGEKRSFTVKAPDTHASEALRNKDVEIEVSLKDIRRLELADITPAFLEDLGFTDEKELRQALREQMDEKIAFDVQQAMREQVNRYLLETTPVTLAKKMSIRQADRVVNRRAMDLAARGFSREQIEANIERLRAGAADEAVRELRLFFILQKIANDQEVEVSEGELNGRVAMLAAQNDKRPEKLKAEMQKNGQLSDLYVQMREQKAIDQILGKAQVEEVEMTPKEGEAAAEHASADAPAGEATAQPPSDVPSGESPAEQA